MSKPIKYDVTQPRCVICDAPIGDGNVEHLENHGVYYLAHTRCKKRYGHYYKKYVL